jgi:hypothetical protein
MTLQIASEQFPRLARSGHFFYCTGSDGKILLVNLFAHKLVIETSCTIFRIHLFQMVRNVLGTAHVQRASTALPKQKLDDAFDVLIIGVKIWVILGQGFGFEAREFVRASFKAKHQSHAIGFNFTAKISICQNSRAKIFIQRRLYARGNQVQRH